MKVERTVRETVKKHYSQRRKTGESYSTLLAKHVTDFIVLTLYSVSHGTGSASAASVGVLAKILVAASLHNSTLF